MSSQKAVHKVRGLTGVSKAGHGGTLDPMACGLLPILLGGATKLSDFLLTGDKGYIAGLRFGLVTDTLDVTGQVLRSSGLRPKREQLEAMLPRFTGELLQTPPMYSAISQGGQKLYKLARQGIEVERAPRRVNIHSLRLLEFSGDGALLEVECSKGTYVRSLVFDLGEALGCGACMSGLRRTRAGGFDVRDALTIEEIERRGAENCLLPVDALFAGRPVVLLKDARAEKALRNGMDVRFDADFAGECRVYAESGEFLALCRAEGGALKTIKSFFEV